MHMTTEILDLKLTTPFRISRSEKRLSPSIIATIAYKGFTGYGEASPSPRYGETLDGTRLFMEQTEGLLGDDPFALEDILDRLQKKLRLNASAKAAVDMALHDLMGKILGVPLYKLLGLNPTLTPQTSFTIGIDTPTEMAKKAQRAKGYPILKIKVGTPDDIERVKAIRDVSSAVLRVDANEGWAPKEAIRMINALSEYNIEFVEQPIKADNLEGLKLIRDNVPLPIIADESCITVEDIPRLAGHVDGINIKLMKCGGIRNALKMIHVARAHNLQIMIGCMIESSLAITAAAHLTPLVDYADLDGNLLIDNDPYEGTRVEQGKLTLPEGPGLGVQLRA